VAKILEAYSDEAKILERKRDFVKHQEEELLKQAEEAAAIEKE
jgi:hypothetical protein